MERLRIPLFEITTKGVVLFSCMVSAKNAKQAWSKFVAQRFSKTPLKPNRKDWIVRKIKA